MTSRQSVGAVAAVGIVDSGTVGSGSTGGDWFDQRAELGRGYKYLPRAAQYALAATRRAFAGADDLLGSTPPERRAICMGTNNAVSLIQGDIDRTIAAHGSHVLSPASAPYFSINLVGSRVAMEHDMKGFSLGYHTPRTAGIEALHGAIRAVATGRADLVLAGAAECPLDTGESEAEGQDGAVLFLLTAGPRDEIRGVSAAGSGGALGWLRARSMFLPPLRRTVDSARRDIAAVLAGLGADSAGAARTDFVLIGPDCTVTSCVHDALQSEVGAVDVRLSQQVGCYEPLRELARWTAAPAGRQRVVVATSEYGNVAAVAGHT